MGLDNDRINVIKIAKKNEHTLEDLMDRGLTFKEANEKMKTEWIELEVSPDGFNVGLTKYKRRGAVDPTCIFPTELEFVKGEVESGKKYYEENIKPLMKSYTATLTRIN